MCGLTGFVLKSHYDQTILQAMNQTLSHRGPNGEGVFHQRYDADYVLGLAHKRLSILDISDAGSQPMQSENGSVIVSYNGEIYNFLSLKKDLENIGYVFHSTCDTEVLIKAYQAWGLECLQKLNGMFAIALYDKTQKALYLIRDRLGVKPLYYYTHASGLIFGSELKALMQHPLFEKNLDMHALSLYMYHGYITAPHSIFRNTCKLTPGTYLEFRHGQIRHHTYWSIKNSFCSASPPIEDFQTSVNTLDDLLTSSVQQRMTSDVPVGSFLSGGIDSSLVTAIMQKLSPRPIDTFTIGFHQPKYDESNFARNVAKHLGTQHHEAFLSTQDIHQWIEKIPQHYDEPFADFSQIPTLLVNYLAKDSVTVVLSGDGADELFCGYEQYSSLLRLPKYIPYARIARYIPGFAWCVKTMTQKFKYRQFFELLSRDRLIHFNYRTFVKDNNLFKHHDTVFENRYASLLGCAQSIQEKAMLADLLTYLPDDILTKVDRASMAWSVENRAPFADDYRIADFAFRTPLHWKHHKGEKKYILKKLLYRYVPKHLVDRPKKGFSIPIDQWMGKELRPMINHYLATERIKKQNLFSEHTVESLKNCFFQDSPRLWKQHFDMTRTLWHFLVFQMWCDAYQVG